jgi:hypothetical protein
MKKAQIIGLSGIVMMMGLGAVAVDPGRPGDGSAQDSVSYKRDVATLLTKHCMPCHAEENANKSELYLDTYRQLMQGGKSGVAVVPGKPEKSMLIAKLSATPPFGDRMPFFSERRKKKTPPVYLTEEEVGVIKTWISEGARDN